MARAKLVVDAEGRFRGIRFDCPGCAAAMRAARAEYCGDGGVVLAVDWVPPGYEVSPQCAGPRWGFNGDLERPTLTPSVLTRFPYGLDQVQVVCHSFVTDGRIQFLGDCTHALAGQTVDLPEIDQR